MTSDPDGKKTRVVHCPEPMAPLFAHAEGIVEKFFAETARRPENAEIQIAGSRYLLVRAESLGLELHQELCKSLGEDEARLLRYKIARALGGRDARVIHERVGVTDPAVKLALGPAHFAHTGWASVDILTESAPTNDEQFYLIYDLLSSFEAAAFIDTQTSSAHPVCLLNAGYAAGWYEASFGVELKAAEISCRACGDGECRFIVAHPAHLERRIQEYRERLRAP